MINFKILRCNGVEVRVKKCGDQLRSLWYVDLNYNIKGDPVSTQFTYKNKLTRDIIFDKLNKKNICCFLELTSPYADKKCED